VSVLLDTGLRVSEVANLGLEEVDMTTGAMLARHRKGSKQRIVRIGSKAQKALWRYVTIYRRRDSDALFLSRSGESLNVVGLKILVRHLTQKAGVKVHVHKLRHMFAISYPRNGGDVFTLQHLLGHATLQMTQRYLQRSSDDDAAKAHRKFSPLDNIKI
jgi:site-specific recombinase XerD